MYNSTYVRGLGRYVRRLNKEITEIEGRTLKGLIRAGIIIMWATERQPPLTPVDTGNLRASRFMVTANSIEMGSRPRFQTDKSGVDMAGNHRVTINAAQAIADGQKYPVVVLGYSAHYAAYVHEAVGKQFKRPNSGAKFFQSAIRNNHKRIISIIAKEVKVS